jgi:hypothetical protein
MTTAAITPNPGPWHKAGRSINNQAECVECATDQHHPIRYVRDSKNPHGPILAFPAARWTAFINTVTHSNLKR